MFHRHAGDVIADQLALAGVNPDPQLYTNLPDRLPNAPRAVHSASGAVEHGEEAVAGLL